jgi:hypothetical protein
MQIKQTAFFTSHQLNEVTFCLFFRGKVYQGKNPKEITELHYLFGIENKVSQNQEHLQAHVSHLTAQRVFGNLL